MGQRRVATKCKCFERAFMYTITLASTALYRPLWAQVQGLDLMSF